jgi:hypothetical protein
VVAVLGVALVVDLHDVGVVERRGAPGFALEALDEGFVVRVALPEDLERYVPAQNLVAGQVHLGHSSASQEIPRDVAAIDEGSPHDAHGITDARRLF